MQFKETNLKGAYEIEIEPIIDERGHFARTFCLSEFEKMGLSMYFVQCSTSRNYKKGQKRGLHFQAAPFQETKIVRCTSGSIVDVIVDLRPNSPTFNQWHSVVLSAKRANSIYIPKDFAHGYQVLEDNSEVFYMMDQFYVAEASREISFESKLPENFFNILDSDNIIA